MAINPRECAYCGEKSLTDLYETPILKNVIRRKFSGTREMPVQVTTTQTVYLCLDCHDKHFKPIPNIVNHRTRKSNVAEESPLFENAGA